MISRKPLVLVLCTGNSCRSQMAEGFLRHFHHDKYEVASAGVDPRPRVHPLAVQVMREVGIDIGSHKPRSVTEFLGRAPVRHILIVCNHADGACPRIWPGAYTREFHVFDDPSELEGDDATKLTAFRFVRDQIEDFCRDWSPLSEGNSKSKGISA